MIKLEHVYKKFGSVSAVNDLNLHIVRGEIFGLLGPNGAGKTTTIRMLTTLARSTGGQIVINGYDMNRDLVKVKGQIGVVPQHMNLDTELTARENLELHCRLHRINRAELRQRIEEMLKFAGLADRTDDLVSIFSGGMKRRLMIARALIHRPAILYLDEPTVGLDPHSRRSIWDLMKSMNTDGMTILLTTHYIEEAEALCHRVGLINQGQLIALGSPRELLQRIGEIVVEYTIDGSTRNKFFPNREEAMNFAAGIEGNVLIREGNLEDVFVELTNRKVDMSDSKNVHSTAHGH
ncbi:ABC transporter ATP-binding protein [Desulfolucanica intricata]|uniref:ABC transporter ATP-binding protein n=1 Tax=Desulfolucanica intricata TaxID=1285191 RepID=UPI00082A8CF8|nr:ATP-binding cassette domain-containing protein [Desulfolucanica intricata]